MAHQTMRHYCGFDSRLSPSNPRHKEYVALLRFIQRMRCKSSGKESGTFTRELRRFSRNGDCNQGRKGEGAFRPRERAPEGEGLPLARPLAGIPECYYN